MNRFPPYSVTGRCCRVALRHAGLLLCTFASLLLLLASEARSGLYLPNPGYSDEFPPYINPSSEKIRYIIYPVLGCPAMVLAGERLTALVSLNDAGRTNDWRMQVATHDRVSQSYTLTGIKCTYDTSTNCYSITGNIPSSTPREVFDLIITSDDAALSDRQPNAVRILDAFRNNYRFAHITDLHFGDPRGHLLPPPKGNRNAGSQFIISRIMTELSFLDPEFILFSGDLVFGSFYFLEYPWAWEVLSSQHLPLFMVPGNHDGYTGGGGWSRDGLRYWEQIVGPLYYSFNYGDRMHVVCINTYDGGTPQRNALGFIAQKWGGTLSPEQLAWVAEDLEEASSEGRTSIMLAHHDPRGNVHGFGGRINPADEDFDGYAEATEFPDSLFYQEWNDSQSGKELVKLIAETNAASTPGSHRGELTHIFLGHVHSDFVDWDEESNSWWVHTTAASSSVLRGEDFWGYRLIEVENNQVVRLNRTAPEGEILPPGDKNPTNNRNRDYQSYAGNNITVTLTEGANDGTSFAVTQKITNRFDTAVSGIVKFFMPLPDPISGKDGSYGYRASGGTIRSIARSGLDGNGDKLIIYVETEVAPGDTKSVMLKEGEG